MSHPDRKIKKLKPPSNSLLSSFPTSHPPKPKLSTKHPKQYTFEEPHSESNSDSDDIFHSDLGNDLTKIIPDKDSSLDADDDRLEMDLQDDDFMEDLKNMGQGQKLKKTKISSKPRRQSHDSDLEDRSQEDEDIMNFGPYDAELHEELSGDDMDFDQEYKDYREEERIFAEDTKAQKKLNQALWEIVPSIESPELPKTYENKKGGPSIPVPAGVEDHDAYRRRYKEELTPIKAFYNFFPEEMFDLILEESISYATQQLEKGAMKKGRSDWKKYTTKDFKNFIGILLWMGIHRIPNLDYYWSHDPLYETSFGKAMGKCKWNSINKIFHLSDNDKADKKDPLYKLRPIINVFEKRFRDMYNIGENVTIDEAMVKWRGNLFFKQNMKGKPIKWGIKLFLLCDAKNGYCHSFKVYTGRRDDMTNFTSLDETEAYLKILREKRIQNEKIRKEEERKIAEMKKLVKKQASRSKDIFNIKVEPHHSISQTIYSEITFEAENVYVEMPFENEKIDGPERPPIIPIKIEDNSDKTIEIKQEEKNDSEIKEEFIEIKKEESEKISQIRSSHESNSNSSMSPDYQNSNHNRPSDSNSLTKSSELLDSKEFFNDSFLKEEFPIPAIKKRSALTLKNLDEFIKLDSTSVQPISELYLLSKNQQNIPENHQTPFLNSIKQETKQEAPDSGLNSERNSIIAEASLDAEYKNDFEPDDPIINIESPKSIKSTNSNHFLDLAQDSFKQEHIVPDSQKEILEMSIQASKKDSNDSMLNEEPCFKLEAQFKTPNSYLNAPVIENEEFIKRLESESRQNSHEKSRSNQNFLTSNPILPFSLTMPHLSDSYIARQIYELKPSTIDNIPKTILDLPGDFHLFSDRPKSPAIIFHQEDQLENIKFEFSEPDHRWLRDTDIERLLQDEKQFYRLRHNDEECRSKTGDWISGTWRLDGEWPAESEWKYDPEHKAAGMRGPTELELDLASQNTGMKEFGLIDVIKKEEQIEVKKRKRLQYEAESMLIESAIKENYENTLDMKQQIKIKLLDRGENPNKDTIIEKKEAKELNLTIGKPNSFQFSQKNPQEQDLEEIISDGEGEGAQRKGDKAEKRDAVRVNIPFSKKKRPEETLTKFVVDTLIKHWENEPMTIYMDNYYTSKYLFEDLLSRNKTCCGTIRANRISGVPHFEKPKQGDCIFFRSREVPNMYLVLYHDTKPVWLLTTKHTPLYTEIKTKNWKGNYVKDRVPHLVEEYNHFTHGVDMNNCETARYRYSHRTSKWWKALFLYFLQLALVNANIWYNQVTKKKMNALNFREEVIRGLITMKERNHVLHCADSLKNKNGEKMMPCKRCKTLTEWFCPGCSNTRVKRMTLCMPKCYKEHHEEKKRMKSF